MSDFIKIVSEALASKKKKLSFKHTSVIAPLTVGLNSNQHIIANQIALGTINTVNIIKNKIVPYVKEYKKLVTTKVDSVKPVSLLDSYKIVEFVVPPIITELKNEGAIVPSKEFIELPISSLIIPPPSDLNNYIEFNSGTVNSLLAEHLSKFSNDELVKIWEIFLGNVSKSNDALASLRYNVTRKIDTVIVLLAMVNSIKTEKQPGVRLSDGNYMQIMGILYNYLGDILFQLEKNVRLKADYDKLILDHDDTTLIVNGLIYDKYLKDGSVEGLLGFLISGKRDRNITIRTLLENQVSYTKSWENAIAREQYRLLSAAPNNYRLAYELSLGELYNNMSEDILTNVVAVSLEDAKSLTLSRLDDIARNSSSDRLMDVDYITRLIMGDIVFHGTLLKEYLYSVVQNHKSAPNLGMDELATMATIELIISYLMEQVDIVEC